MRPAPRSWVVSIRADVDGWEEMQPPWCPCRGNFTKRFRIIQYAAYHSVAGPALVNRDTWETRVTFDATGNGKGPNHIRHPPVLAKTGVEREARAEYKS
jgi:hypothetical protein